MRRWVCAAYTLVLAGLSLAPALTMEAIQPDFVGADKVGHLGAYAVYAVLVLWAWPGADVAGRVSLPRGVAAAAYCTAFGLAMEVLQVWLRPGERLFSVVDIAANLLGAGGAAGLVTSWPAISRRRRAL